MSKISDSTLTLRVLGRSIFRVIGHLCRGRISSFLEEAAVVINGLLDAGHLNIAEHALRRLHAAFPTLPFASNLCGVFDRIPPIGATHSAFRDDPAKDVQIFSRSSDIVVLLFCSSGHNLGLPLPVIHRWFARLPASLIYLRDFKRVYFFDGVQSLGPSREATLAELRRIIASLHGQRIVCFGQSSGTFAALDYGLELGADAILCMAGPTNLSVEFNIHTRREMKSIALTSQFPDARFDMREVYSAVARPPRVCIVYGKNNWDDRDQTEHMEELSCVTLCGIENCSEHNVIMDAIMREMFEGLLDWLVREPEGTSSTAHHRRQSVA
jgi:hypothetical protein